MSSVIFMDSEGNEKELPLSEINGVEDIANAYKDLSEAWKADQVKTFTNVWTGKPVQRQVK